jgi:hypothetical protein
MRAPNCVSSERTGAWSPAPDSTIRWRAALFRLFARFERWQRQAQAQRVCFCLTGRYGADSVVSAVAIPRSCAFPRACAPPLQVMGDSAAVEGVLFYECPEEVRGLHCVRAEAGRRPGGGAWRARTCGRANATVPLQTMPEFLRGWLLGSLHASRGCVASFIVHVCSLLCYDDIYFDCIATATVVPTAFVATSLVAGHGGASA